MTNIPSAVSALFETVVGTRGKQAQAGGAPFDAFLTNAGSKADLKRLSSVLLEKISLSLDKSLFGLSSKDNQNVFPFSGEFEATFGDSGPLIDFINEVTKRLGLSAEKNLALQSIAIRNKDITKTPASVAKIGEELRAAGIA
jgi:hypothetical protein